MLENRFSRFAWQEEFLVDLEKIIRKYVTGQELTPEEHRFLVLALQADKDEVVRFRVSQAERLLILIEAEQAGLNISEYLRRLTIKHPSYGEAGN